MYISDLSGLILPGGANKDLLLRYGGSPPYRLRTRGDVGKYYIHMLFENGSYALFFYRKEVKFKD